MITGLNHITLAVADIELSLAFYVDLLGSKLVHRWTDGAYLDVGGVWLCLSFDPSRQQPVEAGDYTHIAFSVLPESFVTVRELLSAHNVPVWKDNGSEGDSVYFLDPDGHQLEIHVGSLASRMASIARVNSAIDDHS